MPELSTQHATTHTITLTPAELESLRVAARIALAHTDTGPMTKDWEALARVGKVTRPRAHEGEPLYAHTRAS